MKKQVIILVLVLLVLSGGIGIVSAETLAGSLGDSGYNTTGYTVVQTGGQVSPLTKLHVKNIQYSTGTITLTLFQSGVVSSVDAGAPAGVGIPFTAHLTTAGGTQLGDGTIGYQRVFNTVGTELPGSMWIYFNNWSTGGNTGTQTIYLNYSQNAFYNYSFQQESGSDSAVPNGGMVFKQDAGTALASGDYLQLKDISSTAAYTASKPSGIGITGNITKTLGSSQAFVFSATGTILTSQSTVSTSPLNFSVSAEQIKIGIFTSNAVWYNTSVLFSPGITPTPTVTPTPAPTIAPGYVRTTVQTIDGTTGNEIHGSNIFLYDVEGSTWSNSTSDGDGSHYIDTLPYHTINAYATFTVFADHYSDAEALGLPTGYYGGITYSLSMFPPALSPGEGNVNLYVTVQDADTYDIIRDASVQVRLPTGAVQGGNTGSSGTEIFVVPNSTVINIAATKSGYVGSNTVINSGAGTTASATVYLHKAVVTTTPTSTIPAGGITPVITVDSRSASEKDNAMMDKVRDAGPTLIDLAIAATIIGLLGLMAKAF